MLTNILPSCRLVTPWRTRQELDTLVMLMRYAYYKSSGLFVVVRPRNTEVGHPRAHEIPVHWGTICHYDTLGGAGVLGQTNSLQSVIWYSSEDKYFRRSP